jgi:hypothetical protein
VRLTRHASQPGKPSPCRRQVRPRQPLPLAPPLHLPLGVAACSALVQAPALIPPRLAAAPPSSAQAADTPTTRRQAPTTARAALRDLGRVTCMMGRRLQLSLSTRLKVSESRDFSPSSRSPEELKRRPTRYAAIPVHSRYSSSQPVVRANAPAPAVRRSRGLPGGCRRRVPECLCRPARPTRRLRPEAARDRHVRGVLCCLLRRPAVRGLELGQQPDGSSAPRRLRRPPRRLLLAQDVCRTVQHSLHVWCGR